MSSPSSKVWFLAAGKKKVGPLTAAKVLRRMASGKLPDKTLAWKEGMDAWEPLHAIGAFALEETLLSPSQSRAVEEGFRKSGRLAAADIQDESASDVEEIPPASRVTDELDQVAGTAHKGSSGRKKRKKSSRRKKRIASESDDQSGSVESGSAESGSDESVISAESGSDAFASDLAPLYRIERKDMWRAYGLGLDRRRVGLVFLATAAGVLVSVLVQLAAVVHILLALPVALGGALVTYVVGSIGVGALSYHSRHQLLEEEPPTVKEALTFGWQNAAALSLPPLLLSVAWIVPLLVLVLLTLLVKVPYVGPVGTGLIYGVHIALSAATLFLILTAGIGAFFSPVIVAFEGTGVRDTFRVLLGFVKRSTARVALWSAFPSAAFVPFAGLVLAVGALILIPPIALTVSMAGGGALMGPGLGSGGPQLVSGAMAGAVPMLLWVGLFVAALSSILGSVGNSLLSLLYLGGREGNDDLISRDSYLAQQQGA